MKIPDSIEQVFVLTIDRNKDRHDSVNQILRGIDFDFWNGIDLTEEYPNIKHVSQMPDDFFQKYMIERKYVQPWTLGQLGAYTSIKEMVLYAANNNLGATLFFEDDFYPIVPNWKSLLGKAFEELPDDWDILLLGYIYDGRAYKHAYKRQTRFVSRLFNFYNSRVKKLPKIVIPKAYSKHVDHAGVCNGGHAYCLSLKGARLLRDHMMPMRKSGDELVAEMINQQKIKAYAIYPCLFLQNSLFPSKTRL